jgi:hypothetical protein
MIREGRIVRPQFRQAQMFGNGCGFAVRCCAVPIYNHCGLCVRTSSPREAATGFYAGANTSILSHLAPFPRNHFDISIIAP